MREEGDIELRWHDLKSECPPLGRSVILFPQISDVGHLFDVERHIVSNPEYARLRALEQGYTHWLPILVHPQEAEVEARIKAIYEKEDDPMEQFMRGFDQAVASMTDFIKEIVPDRPNVILAIEARFGDRGNTGSAGGEVNTQ